jgi:hypothetical protein
MKILFIMDSPEYLRFYDSAIEELAARGHVVSLAVSHGQERKPVGLQGLQAYAGRVRVLGLVPEHEGMWGDVARALRGVMDFARYLHPSFAAAPVLRARMKRKILPSAYRWLDWIPRLPASVVRASQRGLMACEQAIPVSRAMVEFLRAHAPDVLLVSPLVTAASEQVDWIKAAHACGIRTAVCIASWDNLTNKGLLRIEPDLVVVWNDAQQREAHEYHYIPREKIVTTGAQLFDRWFAKKITRDRDAFCARVGLPDARPFLLFTGSSSFISRSNVEVPFVQRWIKELRASGDRALQDVSILVRPHPYNYREWDSDPLAGQPGVAVYPPRRYNPVDEQNRADFFDSLYHCAAVVGVNTSAMIEAAILGRPVFSLSQDFARTQEGTIHFHHLLPENGGFLRVASSIEEHVRQLSECLRQPDGARAETERFVASFIRPHGLERPATPIFANAIERLGQLPVRHPSPPPVWTYPLRVPLLAAALPQAALTWVDAMNGPTRKRLRVALHRLRKVAGGRGGEIRNAVSAGRSGLRRRVRIAGKQWQKSVIKPLRARIR